MLRSLQSGVSGINTFQGKLDVIGNNIANSNTTGYKTARTTFADAFSQQLTAGGNGGIPMQVGSGVGTASINSLFSQGMLTTTGEDSHLAVSGDGFFVVRDNDGGETYATRAGDFKVNSDGYFVTSKGLRLQGYSDAGLSTHGDIKIDGTGRPQTADPTAAVTGWSVGNDGKLTVHLADGTDFVRGQVLLQAFRDPQALTKEGDNLFSGITAAGGFANPEAPGSNGLGRIQSGSLEMSNVDLAGEFSDLIVTQRGFQASARMISTSDELLQEVINLKR